MSVSTEEKHLGVLPEGFEYQLHLGPVATARELKPSARHRWFYFPHSFSPRLVFELFDKWSLREGSLIIDNFVGSGTTVLAAQERGFRAIGFDMSPLAVMVTNTKTRAYRSKALRHLLEEMMTDDNNDVSVGGEDSPARLAKAFTDQERQVLSGLLQAIQGLDVLDRSFFLVSLIWTARRFSRAVPDGGWFRWQEWPDRSGELRDAFRASAEAMISDVETTESQPRSLAGAVLADARQLPLPPSSVDAVITSPPYANRHDYSRVFHVDLLLLGQAESSIKELRYRSIRSHVEARPPSQIQNGFKPSPVLTDVLTRIGVDGDSRVPPMVRGYFEDIHVSLAEASRVLRPGGRVAYVVGNVQHAGVMVPVDELIAEMAPQSGLAFEKAWVLRLRGNSAQQMGKYGRQPSRESVVMLRKASHD